jgi:hypothetical protein
MFPEGVKKAAKGNKTMQNRNTYAIRKYGNVWGRSSKSAGVVTIQQQL